MRYKIIDQQEDQKLAVVFQKAEQFYSIMASYKSCNETTNSDGYSRFNYRLGENTFVEFGEEEYDWCPRKTISECRFIWNTMIEAGFTDGSI